MERNERFYSWDLVAYGSKEDIERFSNYFKKFAYILHDKDTENGVLKVEHYHIIGTFEQRKSISTLKRYLNNGQNIRGIKLKDKLDRYEYLYHKNNPEKYQYSENDIVTNDRNYFINNDDDNELTIINIIDDINAGLNRRELAKRYGKDFVINEGKYRHYALMVYEEEHKLNKLKQISYLEQLKINEEIFKENGN